MVKVAPSQLQTKRDAGKRGQERLGAPSVEGKWGGLRSGEESHRPKLGHPTPPTAMPEP